MYACPLHDNRHIVEDRIVPVLFFFNDTATTEIYTLSLHDALPISTAASCPRAAPSSFLSFRCQSALCPGPDRKSTRLNSSHLVISYAVFCLKKKKVTSMSYAHLSDHRSDPHRPHPTHHLSYVILTS